MGSRAPRTTWWSTCGCSPQAICSARASSLSTSSRRAHRERPHPHHRWPRRSASPSRWSTWTAAGAPPTPRLPEGSEAPSPRSTFSTGPDTRHPLQVGPPGLPRCPPAPLPGARHGQRFSCGCKWSYFTPQPLPCHDLRVLLKGTLVVSSVCACPCSAAAHLAALCLAAPSLRWVPLSLSPVHPKPPARSSFEGLGLSGTLPGYWGSASFPSGHHAFPV
uniref:Uncharacterized protein n=1 Tax=Bos mutus grunniens TaxID=30521 RepID=A0A8B9X530_BOSMU